MSGLWPRGHPAGIKAGAEWPEKYPVFEHNVLDLRDFAAVYGDISPAVIIGLTRKSICKKDRHGSLVYS